MLALLLAITAVNYLDRTNLSIALPHIKEEFALSGTQEGLLLSAFSWMYVLAQLPGGWLLDRVGPKVAYGWAVLLWSLCTAALALARGFTALLGLRMALGVAEAPAYPANNKLVTTWFPHAERARATAVYTSGQYIGLAVALPLLSWITVSLGWRSMFVATGALGVVLTVVWLRRAHEDPRRHPKANAAELDLLDAGTTAPRPRTRPTWRDVGYLLSRRRLWGMYVSQFCTNGVMWFFLTWFPSYLTDAKHISLLDAGFLAAVPYLAALAGVLLSGYWSDRMLRRGVSPTAARKTPIMIGFVLSGVIVAANYTDAPGLVIAVMSLAFFAQGMSAIGWTLASEIAPLRMLGLSGGVFNFFTNLGGAVCPLVIGVILDRTGSFDAALLFVCALAAVGLLAYVFLLDRVERLPGRAGVTAPARSGPGG